MCIRDRYLAELQAINQELKPEEFHILCVDTNVATCQSFTPYDDLTEMEITGRGGTDMTPGFEYIEQCLPQVETIMCFSDLEFFGDWPPQPAKPVIWLSSSRINDAPYGTVLNVR